MKTVAFVTHILTHYRVRFHELVKEHLEDAGIKYRLIYSDPQGTAADKGDTVELDWAEKIPSRQLRLLGKDIIFQSYLDQTKDVDLLVIGQENRLIANYAAIVLRRLQKRRIAFFGHGKNFQAAGKKPLAEAWKSRWSNTVQWWFTYTDGCASIVEQNGFPKEFITVINNSIDLTAIKSEINAVPYERIESVRADMLSGSRNIAVYVGGIYKEKRIPFLIEAAKIIRASVPDFQLLVMGGGPDAGLVAEAAAAHPWIHHVGPKFGLEKTELVLTAKVWLMPGLVGLAVLDSFAYGVPIVTTDLPYHSPEFDYLTDGVNGVVVKDSQSISRYARAVVDLLDNEQHRATLIRGASESLEAYSIEKMAARFASGAERALKTLT